MRPLIRRAFQTPIQHKCLSFRFASSATKANIKSNLEAFSPITLRDACKCSRCVDQSTMQREFLFSDIPANIQASSEQDASGKWTIKWTNDIPGYDDHVSTFTRSQLDKIRKAPRTDYSPITKLWDRDTFKQETALVGYDEFINDKAGLAKALWLFRRHGLAFITAVPSEPDSVARIAERIGPLRNTFYGNTWDVRSVPQAKNVAYTSKYLGFHMDLLYMKESPSAQFLLCLENTATGGESRFVDTFKAYDVLASENPDHAKLLQRTLIRYEYDNDGHYYTNTKPIVATRRYDDIPRRRIQGNSASGQLMKTVSRVYWSPPFVGSILAHHSEPDDHMAKKVNATKAFADILEREELVYETKMEAGTCVIFDNLRVVHARNAFDMNSGKRWLRGCYLDGQDVTSKELSVKQDILELESKV